MSFGFSGLHWGGRAADAGLLVIRIGIGVSMLAFHGWAKITGGPERWAKIGTAMPDFGVGGFPVVWGFLAGLAESLGSVLLIFGVFFRPAAAMLAFTMMVAATRHLGMPAGAPNAGWSGASHALELLCVYVGLFLIGPGRLALWPSVRWAPKQSRLE